MDRPRFIHLEILRLSGLIAVGIAAFFGTRAFAAEMRAVRARDAAETFTRAQAALDRGDVDDGIALLRRALVRNPESSQYRLKLATALASAHQEDAAEQLLLDLRQAAPEDPEINIQLARLARRQSDTAASRRYYQTALNALWQPGSLAERNALRRELIEFLIGRGERGRALAELMTLSAGTPALASAKIVTARLYLEAGDPRHAYENFVDAVRLDPANATARSGAGDAAFAAHDYAAAHRYLAAIADLDPRLADERDVAGLVLTADPLAPRLTLAERRRRLSNALARADARAAACGSIDAADSDREEAAAIERRMAHLSDAAEIEHAVDLVYRLGQRSARCGPATPLDRALAIIGHQHGADNQ